MGEKRGGTGKLLYDFNTAAVCEVSIKEVWYRTTAREFRSFDGERRLTEPIKQPAIGDSMFDVLTKTYQYNGPVYVLLTNLEVVRMNTSSVVTNPFIPEIQKSIPNSNRI
jgi:hypothetical protein